MRTSEGTQDPNYLDYTRLHCLTLTVYACTGGRDWRAAAATTCLPTWLCSSDLYLSTYTLYYATECLTISFMYECPTGQ